MPTGSKLEVAPPDARGESVDGHILAPSNCYMLVLLRLQAGVPEKILWPYFWSQTRPLLKPQTGFCLFSYTVSGARRAGTALLELSITCFHRSPGRARCAEFCCFFFRVRDLAENSDIPFAALGRAVDDSVMGFLRNSCRGMFFFFPPPPPQPAIISRNLEE